jgi:2-iminobutanoate/2-iminopropanoate deaminase
MKTKRLSIDVPGLDHVNPVPSASRIGPLLASSGISGRDPATGAFPPTIELQCAQMFKSMREILKLGGATPEDVVRVAIWLKNPGQPEALDAEWLAMFPDPKSRPARTVLPNHRLDPPMLIQCDCLAILER